MFKNSRSTNNLTTGASVATSAAGSLTTRSRDFENGKRRPSIQKVVTKARRTILGSLDQNQGRYSSVDYASKKRLSVVSSTSSAKKSIHSSGTKKMRRLSTVKKSTVKPKISKPEQMLSPQIDRNYEECPQHVAEFAKDIFDNLREKELKHRPKNGYMLTKQDEITESMRGILVDWLIDVHYKFGMHAETLYLTINIADRFLSKTRISKSKLQLVGVTALLLASKYEEIFPPSVRKLKEICAEIYTRDNILQMEQIMIDTLRYNLTVVTPFQFLSRFWKVACNDEQMDSVMPRDPDSQLTVKHMMFYMSELLILDYQSAVQFLPSVQAAACLFVSLKIAHGIENREEVHSTTDQDLWNDHVHYYTGYRLHDIQPCVDRLIHVIEKERVNVHSTKLNTIRKKWSRSSRSRVATFVPDHLHVLTA